MQERPREATGHLRVWVTIEISLSQHGSQAAGVAGFVTGVFLVTTELFSSGFQS